VSIVALFLISLSAVPAILTARYIINMRKRLTHVEKLKERLKAESDARLRAEERKGRDLQEKLYKAQEEYKRLEDELKRQAEQEEERRRAQEEEHRRLAAEKQAHERAENQKVERFESELQQFKEQLFQAGEERKRIADELQKSEKGRARIEEGLRKLQEEEQRWIAEKEAWNKAQKEMAARFDAQRRELEERIHKAHEERNCLKETIREMIKSAEELHQKHVKEDKQWKSEIEARDKNQKEMIEKFDAERRRLEEEIKQKIWEQEEKWNQQAEEEQRRRAEEEKLKEAQKEIIIQLEAERQQLKERLSKTDQELKRVREELERTGEEARGRVEIEKLKHLEVKRQQLEERLFESKKKRRYLIKKLRKIAPSVRGGRPRGLVGTGDNGSREQGICSLKPEIICWKEGWSWIIGVELSEGLEPQSVTQGGILLECDVASGNRYPLKQVESSVEITWSGGRENISLLGSEKNYLIFKMRNNWKEPGRLVRYSTAGYYLIIAPHDWERDTEISGNAGVNPENTQFERFKAHFFYQGKTENAAIGLITVDGKRVRVGSKNPQFQLVGNEICDASEDKGPLFGEQPPQIQVLSGVKGWNDVGIIVVGEEGSGKNKWRDSFTPNVNAQEQTNLNELINGRSGWYFVRIYDKNNDLIESVDFRFLRNLRNIQIQGSAGCLPGPAGHQNILVKFLHHPDCKIELEDEDKQHLLDIYREDDQTTIKVPPHIECDQTNWILNDGEAKIEVTISTERIWWFSGTLETVPSSWTDRPVSLYRKDFTAITDNALWVRLPRPRFTRGIEGGFDQASKRFYQVEVEKKEAAIPLRDFCDCEEFQRPKQECTLYLFIESEAGLYSTPVLKIITSYHCKNCPFTTDSEQEALSHITFHLTDLVPHLSYDELWQRSGGSLPRKIYKCGYCSFYASTDDLENPTSKICLHIEHDCKKAIHEYGTAKIYFSVVTDVDEIREKVKLNLPHIYRCQICRNEFHGDDRESMLNHLKVVHKDELFRYF
jgi:hypothetical protein